jgi:hypothetical protein
MPLRPDTLDFGRPLQGGPAPLFAAFGVGPFAMLPRGARIAQRNGAPALSLSLVRQSDRPGEAGDYAVLDLEVEEDLPLDEALALVRDAHGDATIAPAPVALGFARLTSAGSAVALPADALAPVPLGWSAAGGARWTAYLSLDSGELIKGGLLNGAALFGAWLELSFAGVAARAAATAAFVPAALVEALLPEGGSRAIGTSQLLERLSGAGLPLDIDGGLSPTTVAQPICDRLLSSYAVLIPAAAAGGSPCFRFDADLPLEQITWDLQAPADGVRAITLTLDPLAPSEDQAALIREVVIPPLDLGFREVVATANLPRARSGVPAIGVRLSLPPDPPERPSGINQTATFTPPDDLARVDFRLGLNEDLAYTVTPFALLVAGAVVAELDGDARPGVGPWLRTQPNDFPVRFAHITASDRLLAQATIAGALTYTWNGRSASQAIALQPGSAEAAVAAPAAARDASITLTARAASGAAATLGPLPLGVIRLDLPSFSGYGPHRIAIAAQLPADAPPLDVDLSSEDGAAQGSVTLTASSPMSQWGYVAGSPFASGYHYRARGGAWSAPLPFGASLMLKADGSMTSAGGTAP